MKIAAIYESPYRWGRWERFDLIVEGLRSLGHEVIILSYGPSDGLEENVLPIDISGRPIFRMLNEVAYRLSLRLLDKVGYVLMAASALRRYQPDVVLFHYASSGLPLLLATRLLAHPPLFVFDWNDLSSRMTFWPDRFGLRFRIANWLEERLVPTKADYILVVTKFARDLLKSWGLPEDRIYVLNELVSLEPYLSEREAVLSTSERERRHNTLVWHGFIRSYQMPGLETTVKALNRLELNGIPCRLEIIGPFERSEDEQKLRSLISTHEARVDLIGPLSKKALRSHLLRADVGLQILPNELFTRFIDGVKLAEYICAGLPVVVTDLEGPAELVRGNGFLAKPADVEDLAEKISLALGSERHSLAKRSLDIASQEFSQDSIRNKIHSFSSVLQSMRGEPKPGW